MTLGESHILVENHVYIVYITIHAAELPVLTVALMVCKHAMESAAAGEETALLAPENGKKQHVYRTTTLQATHLDVPRSHAPWIIFEP